MTTHSPRYALVIDSRKCINCKACAVSWRAEHRVPLGKSRNWLNEEHRGEWPRLIVTFEPEQCHHCSEPACVEFAPPGHPASVRTASLSSMPPIMWAVDIASLRVRMMPAFFAKISELWKNATSARKGWTMAECPRASTRVLAKSGSSEISMIPLPSCED
jgi:hypothetical protein